MFRASIPLDRFSLNPALSSWERENLSPTVCELEIRAVHYPHLFSTRIYVACWSVLPSSSRVNAIGFAFMLLALAALSTNSSMCSARTP